MDGAGLGDREVVIESSTETADSEALVDDASAIVGLEYSGGDCIAELPSEAVVETPGGVIRDDAGELETPCEEDSTSELVPDPSETDDTGGATMLESDNEGLMTMLESDNEGLMTMLESDEEGLMAMLETDGEGLMVMLDSDDEVLMATLEGDEDGLITMLKELVKVLLVVST